MVRTGSRLRPDRQRLCPTVCGRPSGDHLRHTDAGENVQSLRRALRPRRKPDGKGYELIILPPECSPPLDDAETTAAWMNKIVEQCIMMAPEQYMWLHRRFKTRPEGMPSRY